MVMKSSTGAGSILLALDDFAFLSSKRLLLSSACFVVLLLLLHTFTEPLRCNMDVQYNCQEAWPIGIGYFRVPSIARLGVAALISVLFSFAFLRLRRVGFRLKEVILISACLLMATNLLQNGTHGWSDPIACCGDNGIQYYHDAAHISEPLDFVRHYAQLQSGLGDHSRVHPVGPVLTLYVLRRLLNDPALIGLSIALASTLLSSLFLGRILSKSFCNSSVAGYWVFVFMTIPAVQIYYLATVDALVSSCVLGAVCFFLDRRNMIAVLGCGICLFLSSFLTFGFLFALPVFILYDILVHRSVMRSSAAAAIVLTAYVLFYFLTGFNYLDSFSAGSAAYMNAYHVTDEPASYIFTRMQDVLEILIFFGPALMLLAIRGVVQREGHQQQLWLLGCLGIASLAAVFLSGAYSGETARACLFIYPFLIFLVSRNSDWGHSGAVGQGVWTHLPYWVFGQALAMQAFGSFFW